jgi:PPK2 family polyphosphate:nucleotide phosphotransferase
MGRSETTMVKSRSFWVRTGDKFKLADIDPGDTGAFERREDVEDEMEKLRKRLEDNQEMLYAGQSRAVLFVFQGMDTSGKDGVIRNVFTSFNPQGLSVYSFKAPTAEESAHDFLWRAHRVIPAKGYIAAFNRSYYEEVLITRVHKTVDDAEAKRRFKHINHFESMLTDSGVKVVKIFLHISKEFQLEKLRSRLVDPNKHWKFDKNDLVERKSWNKYRKAYEEAIRNCASPESPWYVVPADNRWFRDYAVMQIVADTLDGLDLSYPAPDPELKNILLQMEK